MTRRVPALACPALACPALACPALACLALACFSLGCRATKIMLDTGVVLGDDSEADTDSAPDSAPDSADDSSPDTGDTGDGPPLYIPDITVDCTGAADYTEIQPAIEAARSGDVIAVAPCVYHERLDLLGKSVEIYGTDGSATTIVHADFGGTVLSVVSGEGDGTLFQGFTLTGGVSGDAGAGITVFQSVLNVKDVLITGCGESYSMIAAETAWLDMTDVTIADNRIAGGGSAVMSHSGSLTALRLTADCGSGSYGLYEHNATHIDESTLTCAGGYGFYSHHGELSVLRSTLTGGIAGLFTEDEDDSPSEQALITNSAIGGGLVGVDVRYVHVELTNSVIWGSEAALSYLAVDPSSAAVNTVFMDAACGVSGDAGAFRISSAAFFGNAADACGATATAVVSDDPLFVSFPDDLTLMAGSPLIDAGISTATYNDDDGTRNDIGRWGGPLAE
ncbi:MAG: hypothetical protein EXR69_06290 [Myxococcales bacterium]|nr:hypothetical protein [Myxococcales bacterium]